MAAAGKALLLTFGNARSIIDSPTLLQQFLSLPRAAVQALFESPELATDAEASVLLLFSDWCDTEQGQACSEDEVKQLNGTIRYSRLSVPYLTELLLCESLSSPQLTKQQLMEVMFARSLAKRLAGNAVKAGRLVGPPGWYLPTRPPSPAHTTAELTLTLKAADLRALLAGCVDNARSSSRTSAACYFAGFLWALKIHMQGGKLWWAVCAEGVSSLNPSKQGVRIMQGITCEISVQMKQSQPPVVLWAGSEECLNCAGTGVSLESCLPLHGELSYVSFEWWAQHMVEGCVHISADIKKLAA